MRTDLSSQIHNFEILRGSLGWQKALILESVTLICLSLLSLLLISNVGMSEYVRVCQNLSERKAITTQGARTVNWHHPWQNGLWTPYSRVSLVTWFGMSQPLNLSFFIWKMNIVPILGQFHCLGWQMNQEYPRKHRGWNHWPWWFLITRRRAGWV